MKLEYSPDSKRSSKEIAVIGGGWYGSHIALTLGSKGYNVTLYEKNSALFSEISGLFGIRLHIGPHYPRSQSTRKSCLTGFLGFSTKYPELIVAQDSSIYSIGETDARDQPSKVDSEEFAKVCAETSRCEVLDSPQDYGYKNLKIAIKVDEPSICVGRGLHDFFMRKLKEANVRVVCNYGIESTIKLTNGQIQVTSNESKEIRQFDYVINATSFQTLLPKQVSLPFEVFYQPCLALVYKDTKPSSANANPFSFIVMDGWFPCMMPIVKYDDNNHDNKHEWSHEYVLTHGMWTILASYNNVENAREHLSKVDDNFVVDKVKPECEKEINRFWPSFEGRFKYVRWIGAVLAKIKNNREFRSSVTFQDKESGMIYALPGKVSNIFDTEKEVNSLIENKNTLSTESYIYVKNGTLDTALPEFQEPVTSRNTCDLQTFREYGSGEIEAREKARGLDLLRRQPEFSRDEGLKSGSVFGASQKSLSKYFLTFVLLLVFMLNENSDAPNALLRGALLVTIMLGAVGSKFKESGSNVMNILPDSLWRHDNDRDSSPEGAAPDSKNHCIDQSF